ncbi:hypothetical protein OF83DRAFT_1158920 [Amylostereum chailletii]|nr:hypothetical protein OF83DRAFT_1158920 [Amylostereum chailletii]
MCSAPGTGTVAVRLTTYIGLFVSTCVTVLRGAWDGRGWFLWHLLCRSGDPPGLSGRGGGPLANTCVGQLVALPLVDDFQRETRGADGRRRGVESYAHLRLEDRTQVLTGITPPTGSPRCIYALNTV